MDSTFLLSSSKTVEKNERNPLSNSKIAKLAFMPCLATTLLVDPQKKGQKTWWGVEPRFFFLLLFAHSLRFVDCFYYKHCFFLSGLEPITNLSTGVTVCDRSTYMYLISSSHRDWFYAQTNNNSLTASYDRHTALMRNCLGKNERNAQDLVIFSKRFRYLI